jgi:hypothetical protein
MTVYNRINRWSRSGFWLKSLDALVGIGAVVRSTAIDSTYSEVRIESSDLGDVQPAEYRADLVLFLWCGARKVLGVMVEVQLQCDEDKQYTRPVGWSHGHGLADLTGAIGLIRGAQDFVL